jgi:hypothetical protein
MLEIISNDDCDRCFRRITGIPRLNAATGCEGAHCARSPWSRFRGRAAPVGVRRLHNRLAAPRVDGRSIEVNTGWSPLAPLLQQRTESVTPEDQGDARSGP